MSGDLSILIAKSILDIFTAMIFALLPGRDGVAGSDPTSDNLPRTLFAVRS